MTDPETFTSLTLLNRNWRLASQKPRLYAHHLSRCQSYSIAHNIISGPLTIEELPALKAKFVQEIKRNLFAAYLQPRQTNISLISTTTSSSAAFPGGEAFEFVFSPKGYWCLALSSSRIIVLETACQSVSVKRELKVLRRPFSAAILDDGGRLAVLSTNHQVNIYDLTMKPSKRIRSISLDNPPNVITLSPKGEVLATAYDEGVEVHSLAENALPTDSRAVKCDRVDQLAFSSDGTMLLGTTQANKDANTVIISAPYFTDVTDHEIPHEEAISHMWTSQILFPHSSRDCSHATLLPHRIEGDANWTLAYDRAFESFRAVRTDDLRNGTTYFTGPKAAKSKQRKKPKNRLIPCTLPSITRKGDLVAAGFLTDEVWLYGVPEGLNVHGVPNMVEHSPGNTTAGPSTPPTAGNPPPSHTVREEDSELERLPRWQVLVDKYRNVFAKGRRIIKVPGVTNMCWVSPPIEEDGRNSINERLIIAAPGGVCGFSELDQEELASVDGGRLIILDFDQRTSKGPDEEVVLEVGEIEPEMLEEKNIDMATEIAIVRRRTVAQRNIGMSRASVVDALRPMPGEIDIPEVPPIPPMPAVGFGLDEPTPSEPVAPEGVSADESAEEGPTLAEVSEALDDPYSHTQPRSRTTLYRSATAVAANRRRNPPRVPALPSSGRVQYRRTDGTELPHESDADNWVPPPPPYTPDPDRPLPDHIRRTLLSTASTDHELPDTRPRPIRSQTTREGSFRDLEVRRRSSPDVDQLMQVLRRPENRRQHSDNLASISSRQRISAVSPVSLGSNAGDIISPGAPSPLSPGRRPMSTFERRASIFRGRIDTPARENSPVPPVPPILSVLPGQSTDQTMPPSPSHTLVPPENPARTNIQSTQLTLSGSNLQQRLDYPLPPPPPVSMSPVDSPEVILPPPERDVNTPTASPHNIPDLRSELPAPSAYQLNNLQNRYNPSPTWPSSNPRSNIPFINHGHAMSSPSPPRGALGAAGNSRPSSRSSLHNSVEAPARALSRSGSINSQRSLSQSYSTPNLTRPPARRLDTIQSVASGLSHTRSRSRDSRPISRMRTRSEGPIIQDTVEEEIEPARERRGWMSRLGRRDQDSSDGTADLSGRVSSRMESRTGLRGESQMATRAGSRMASRSESRLGWRAQSRLDRNERTMGSQMDWRPESRMDSRMDFRGESGLGGREKKKKRKEGIRCIVM